MKSEKEKMLAGEWYDPTDQDLSEERLSARLLLKQINDLREDESKHRLSLIKKLIPHSGEEFWLQPPFYCDYGTNITVGAKVFFNFNCVILDVAKVIIGHRTFLGPNVQIYTATHPISPEERATGLESGKSISIGNDVWIGGNVVICPGVTIGDGAVIGAGSVVTKDVSSRVVAAGNPCRIVRMIDNEE